MSFDTICWCSSCTEIRQETQWAIKINDLQPLLFKRLKARTNGCCKLQPSSMRITKLGGNRVLHCWQCVEMFGKRSHFGLKFKMRTSISRCCRGNPTGVSTQKGKATNRGVVFHFIGSETGLATANHCFLPLRLSLLATVWKALKDYFICIYLIIKRNAFICRLFRQRNTR